MKEEKLLSIFVLPLMWLVYFIFELVTGRVTNIETLIGNIALILVFAIVGYLIYLIKIKIPNGLSYSMVFKYIFLFLLIDQGIKLIIKLLFFNKEATIIKGFLFFSPLINTDGSWLNARFNTNISFSLLIIFNAVCLILFLELYRYLLTLNKKSFWIDMCFIFIFTGALCSLIDKVFYGGSLDFIGIGNLFVADIKDLYINLGLLFFILAIYSTGYLNSNEESTFKEDLQAIKKYLSFIKNDIFRKKKDD